MKLRTHTYLYKLLMIIFLFLFVPVTIFFQFFWNQSFDKMEKGNKAYYEKILESFADSFAVKIQETKGHAASVVAYSKESRSAFWRGIEGFSENKYWFYEAVDEMKKIHNNYNVSMFGIYYYDLDCIITANGTKNADTFLRSSLNVESNNGEIHRYFDEENYNMGKMIYGTSNIDGALGGGLLVGYCTTMGKNHDKVMIFHVIAPNDYKESLSIVYGSEGINFYIMSSETNDIYLALGDASKAESVLSGVEKETSIARSIQNVVYQKSIDYLPLNATIYIEENVQQNNLIEFYYSMRKVLLLIIAILFLICLIILYVAYRPLYKITSELDYCDGDEFMIIRNALNQNSSRIQEQEMLIMDLIMKNLIHGVPIAEKRVKRLGIDSSIRYYCAFVLEGHMILSMEVEQITREIEKVFAARFFATDWQGKSSNVFIVFLKDENTAELETWLNEWFEEHYLEEYNFYSGKVVNKLDDIRLSLLSCLEKKQCIKSGQIVDKKEIKEEFNSLKVKDEQQQKMKEEILTYLEIHYRDEELSQSQVADVFGISNYTLSRMFKNQVGVGFTEYVNSKRLEYAKELLLTTDYSVQEISIIVGFSNGNYFSRIFKSKVGVSATSFREK